MVLCGLAALFAGCQRGERPLVQVQFCLHPGASRDHLKAALREIAENRAMQYFDWSAQTEADLRSLKDLPPEVRRSFPIINVAVRRKDGMGVGGGNSGLPAGQVSLGFTAGGDKGEAEAFAKEVIDRLEKQWDLVRVPADRGAFPLDCPQIPGTQY